MASRKTDRLWNLSSGIRYLAGFRIVNWTLGKRSECMKNNFRICRYFLFYRKPEVLYDKPCLKRLLPFSVNEHKKSGRLNRIIISLYKHIQKNWLKMADSQFFSLNL